MLTQGYDDAGTITTAYIINFRVWPVIICVLSFCLLRPGIFTVPMPVTEKNYVAYIDSERAMYQDVSGCGIRPLRYSDDQIISSRQR
jgi:hypothetical protein